MGMEQCKAVVSPGNVGDERRSVDEDEEAETEKHATMYRSVTAKLNYLAQDRPDIVFAVNRLTMAMPKPEEALQGEWHWWAITWCANGLDCKTVYRYHLEKANCMH